MKNRPSITGLHEKSAVSRDSWAAVYSTDLNTRGTPRLRPRGIADFSPAVSPSGEWTAVASSGEEDLVIDIYVFKARNGSERTRVAVHGGWPCWSDDSNLYFHRQSNDGWWSVYQIGIAVGEGSIAAVTAVERPSRRPHPRHRRRRIQLPGRGDPSTGVGIPPRRALRLGQQGVRRDHPQAHHYNPFLSPDAARIGYHRCSGGSKPLLLLENNPEPRAGDIPHPNRRRVPVYIPGRHPNLLRRLSGVYVASRDGSGRRRVFPGFVFSTAWGPKRGGVIYTSNGPGFASEDTTVDVASVHLAGDGPPAVSKLTP